MLLTFADIKSELGIDHAETDMDSSIARCLRMVCGRIRQQTGRKIHWTADNFSVASDGTTVTCRCINHGLSSGATIKVVSSTTESSIDATYTNITRLNQDQLRFTLGTAISSGNISDWNDTGLTASAVIHPTQTVECQPTTPRDIWVPQNALPWLEATELARWDGDSWEALSSGDWYPQFDMEPVKAGRLCTEDTFEIPGQMLHRRYGLRSRSTDRNYRITYRAGASECPGDIQMAAMSLVCDLIELEGGGKDHQSESHEGSSLSRMSGDERREHLLSADNVISNWRAR